MAPKDILKVVADRFNDVRVRLDSQMARSDIQITRTTQVQRQLEAQREEIARLRSAIDVATDLLHNLMNNLPWQDLRTRGDC